MIKTMMARAWAVLVILSGAVTAAAEDGTIVLASNRSISARDITMKADGGKLLIQYVDAGGSRKTVQADDVVEIALGKNRPTPAARPTKEALEVTLTTDDVLHGNVGAASDDGVNLQSKIFGNPLIRFEHIRSVVFSRNRLSLPRQTPTSPDVNDRVYMTSGDRAQATVLSVSKKGLVYFSARLKAEVTLTLEQSAGFWLTPTEKAPAEPDELFVIVLTSEGSSLRGKIESLKDGILTMMDLYGARRKIATDAVDGLYMINGRVVYLSDMEPSEVDEDANFIRGLKKSASDLEYPFKPDRNARGTKLILGGVEHRKGIGVRAHSSLTFVLGGGFKRFQTTFGLDDVSRGLGAVAAEIWVDGKKVKALAHKGRQNPEALDIDVTGARNLKLIVTWAGNGQSDFADWGSARLIR